VARVRPFNPDALTPHAPSVALSPFRGKCWKHTLLVPLYEVPLKSKKPQTTIFSAQDRDALEQAFVHHLGGYTKENRENAPLFMGIGYRGAELERNIHAVYLVYTNTRGHAWKYMLALVGELQECTGEKQTLLERTEAFIASV